MKIVTKSNYNEDLYVEQVVAENLNEYWAKELVKVWNDKYGTETSNDYLEAVDDDYVPYDGYAELI